MYVKYYSEDPPYPSIPYTCREIIYTLIITSTKEVLNLQQFVCLFV